MTKLSTNTNIDEKMWDIYTHKEEYRKPFLQKAKLWLMHNGYSEECDELGRYIDSLEQDMSENTNNNVNDEKMWDIYIHKEQYGKSLLEEAELWLMCNGYSEECDELGHYIDSLEQDMSEDSDESEDNINSLEQNEYEYIPVKPQIISGDFRRLFKAETPVTFCG